MNTGPLTPTERLRALLRGERCERPPLWEPWFQMWAMLRADYGDDYAVMARHLGHAAMPGAYFDNPFSAFRRTSERNEQGVWYAGGTLTPSVPPARWTLVDHGPALARGRERAAHARAAGLAVWHTLPWGFHAVATAMGLENFAFASVDDPDWLRAVIGHVEESNRRAITALGRDGQPDFWLLDGDCAYRSGLMVDPTRLRHLTREATQRTLALLRELGVPCAFHSDGRLDDLIPYLVELGITAVHGCESQANDLGHLVTQFGDAIVLCGNMDVVFLTNQPPAAVRAATHRMLDTGAARGRFIAGCNTSPQDYIPTDHYRAFAETVRDYE